MIFLLLIHLIYLIYSNSYVINKCQSCCKVQILSLYNPLSSNHKYNFNNDSEIYWVMDFQFDNENVVTTISGNELEFRLRALYTKNDDEEFTRQSFTLNSYQMISMYHNNNYVMDFCGSIRINTPLIPWTKKDPKNKDTNNQRFIYIYNNPKYSGRGYKYPQTFYVPYKTLNDKDICFTVGSEYNQVYPCMINHNYYGTNKCDYTKISTKVNDTYYILNPDYSYLDMGYEITAQYCYSQVKNYSNYYLKERQTWMLIYY